MKQVTMTVTINVPDNFDKSLFNDANGRFDVLFDAVNNDYELKRTEWLDNELKRLVQLYKDGLEDTDYEGFDKSAKLDILTALDDFVLAVDSGLGAE